MAGDIPDIMPEADRAKALKERMHKALLDVCAICTEANRHSMEIIYQTGAVGTGDQQQHIISTLRVIKVM